MRPDGSITISRRFPMSEANLIQAFTGLGQDAHVHMEAGEFAAWVRSVISPLVKRVVISHPRSNACIANDSNKCDRIDATKLADLLRMNRLTEVYYAQETSRRDFKQLVQHYDDLTDQQVRLKNKIKARMRAQGTIVRDGRLFTRKRRVSVIEKVPSPDLHLRQATCSSMVS
jgi:transposase